MSNREAVEAAITNAGAMRLGGDGIWLPELSGAALTIVPAEADHDYPVTYPDREDLVIGPNVVAAETPRDLLDRIYDFHSIKNWPVHGNVFKRINDEVLHEVQHAEGSQRLGSGSVMYGIRIHVSEDSQYIAYVPEVYHLSLRTTKLGVAVLSMYPSEPSPGDVAVMRGLGYKNVAEVAQAAEERGLPTPLSSRKA